MKELTAQDYIQIIEYNYHLHPTTWGKCMDNCGGSARGSGLCVECATDKLADIVGIELAMNFAKGVRELHRVKMEIVCLEDVL